GAADRGRRHIRLTGPVTLVEDTQMVTGDEFGEVSGEQDDLPSPVPAEFYGLLTETWIDYVIDVYTRGLDFVRRVEVQDCCLPSDVVTALQGVFAITTDAIGDLLTLKDRKVADAAGAIQAITDATGPVGRATARFASDELPDSAPNEWMLPLDVLVPPSPA